MTQFLFLSMCVAVPMQLVSVAASAQAVYKCLKSAGQYEFSDLPCAVATPSTVLKVQPNTLRHDGERELKLRQENAQLRHELVRRDLETPAPTRPHHPADLRAERADSMECKKARRDYEVTANSRLNPYTVIQAKRDSMMVVCGR